MYVAIETLLAFEGPNIIGPQSAVLLRLRCPADWSARLRTVMKDMAQRVGLVVGYLDVDGVQEGDQWFISASFTTPLPHIGRAVATLAVDALRARAFGDDEWDADNVLYELGRQRRQEAAPLTVLQIEAEAIRRNVPLTRRVDGRYQIGSGAVAWTFDAAAPLVPPWDDIGCIPIIAFAGGAAREAALQLVETAFRHAAPHVRVADNLDHERAAELLSNPDLDQLFAGVSAYTIASNGLPFDRCFISAILDLEGAPPAGLTDEEWVQALGVPMLVTEREEGFVILNADDARVAALANYAPCRVVFVSTGTGGNVVAAHRAAGGAALVVCDGSVVMAVGDDEQPLGSVPPQHGAELLGTLAAGIYLLGLRGYGIDIPLPWEEGRTLKEMTE